MKYRGKSKGIRVITEPLPGAKPIPPRIRKVLHAVNVISGIWSKVGLGTIAILTWFAYSSEEARMWEIAGWTAAIWLFFLVLMVAYLTQMQERYTTQWKPKKTK